MITAARRLLMVVLLGALFAGLGDRDAPEAAATPELDVLVIVDTTTSMSALDSVAGSRIRAARRDLTALADTFESARFTVVTVGRSAEIALPATSDRVALQEVVSYLEAEPPDVGSGSSVDRAVPLAERLLRHDDGGRPRVLLYLGDGENTGPVGRARFGDLEDLLDASLVLGYGTETGGLMPLDGQGAGVGAGRRITFVPDATGEPAVSKASPATLAEVAEQLGGTFALSSGSADLSQLSSQLQQAAYSRLDPVLPGRELSWVWGLALLVLGLFELRTAWRGWLVVRREVSG